MIHHLKVHFSLLTYVCFYLILAAVTELKSLLPLLVYVSKCFLTEGMFEILNCLLDIYLPENK